MRGIVSYIASDNPSAALAIPNSIFDSFAALAENSGMGHTRNDLTRRSVRFWTVLGRYTIVYREQRNGVQIVRVLGPGRDVAKLLR